MMADARPQDRLLGGALAPPWLLVVGLVCTLVPAAVVSSVGAATQVYEFSRAWSWLTGWASYVLGPLSLLFAALVSVIGVSGLVVIAVPQLRCWWIEWRFAVRVDERRVLLEIQEFVHAQDASLDVRFSLSSGQVARVYPVSWRRARLLVFRPLATLWRTDVEAARLVLLHEIAHRRQGDHLLMGLGSPFTALARIGIPAALLMVGVPAAVYVIVGDEQGVLSDVRGGLAWLQLMNSSVTATVLPLMLIGAVFLLWLAELNADRLAVHQAGTAPLQRVLESAARPPRLLHRIFAGFSHPPRRLRLFAAVRPALVSRILVYFPAVVVLGLLGFLAASLLTARLMFGALADSVLPAAAHAQLETWMLPMALVGLVLLCWPAAAARYERLWISGAPAGARPAWPPFLAAATPPLAVAALAFVPVAPAPFGISEILENPEKAIEDPRLKPDLPGEPKGICPDTLEWTSGSSVDGAPMRRVHQLQYELTMAVRTADIGAGTNEAQLGSIRTKIHAVGRNLPPSSPGKYYKTALASATRTERLLRSEKISAAKTEHAKSDKAFNAGHRRQQEIIAGCTNTGQPPSGLPTGLPTDLPSGLPTDLPTGLPTERYAP